MANNSTRDANLDIIRGAALLTITLNHFGDICFRLGMSGLRIPTMTLIGYSGSAEVFVAVSGYLYGAVFSRLQQTHGWSTTAWRSVRRAATLYRYNALLCAVAFALAAAGGSALVAATGFDAFTADPTRAAAEFLLMRRFAYALDILPLYIYFLIAAPLSLLLASVSPLALLAISGTTYLLATLGALPGGAGTFNPFAWQLLFIGSLLLGRMHAVVPLTRLFAASRRSATAAWLGLFIFTAICIADRCQDPSGVMHFDMPWVARYELGPVRVVHAGVLLISVIALCSRVSVAKSLAGRLLARLGQTSAEGFVLSVIVTFAGAAAWLRCGRTWFGYLCMCVFMTGTMFGFAILRARRVSSPMTRGAHVSASVITATPPNCPER